MKYYLDTCIWFDFAENRSDNTQSLGKPAKELMNKISKANDTLILSPELMKELKKCYGEERIRKLFSPFSDIELVFSTKKQQKEAYKVNKVRKVGFTDALHAILARDSKAQLVTRDRHFRKLTDITIAKKPEELL